MAIMIGKSKVVKPDVIHQTILPSSFAELHPAMQWPERFYAGNRIIEPYHGERMILVHGEALINYLPSVPKSWETIYGARN